MIEEWIEVEKRPSSTKFLCPHCRSEVIYPHGANARNRRFGIRKRCLYDFCPWCGKPVMPLYINYISDD